MVSERTSFTCPLVEQVYSELIGEVKKILI